ncbi:hypothetical protein [Rubricoccus marinus]|uniref:Uncharacterized protein n=1 Tax=Rubricoccus marinus TaxID=716817 RepID=A0A259TTY0_9BACT|nr:hypothetical protein [Rubricoccus marinus]OZC01189.1 hypothetical protein BSZ36_18200 [Rubricoccus marinus]
MIQVLTGKFFATDDVFVTSQRGVLHTNYALHRPITTPVGVLKPVDDVFGQRPLHLVYEFEQRIEKVRRDGTKEFIMGVGVDSILVDMAAILSFELQVTCSPTPDVVARLTRKTKPPHNGAPASFVARVFDPEVKWDPSDGPRLATFIEDLVGLRRDRFESVMRAIRRYVTALRRLDDDPGMAYALLVAAVESLAQKYDDHETNWSDLPDQRRAPIDKALEGVEGEEADRVREAILQHEHLALGRRFQAFTTNHIPDSFFRVDAVGRPCPIPRDLIGVAVRQAYNLRSSAVHTLSGLPDPIGAVPSHADYTAVEGRPALTVAGLTHVARAAIREFVRRSEKVETEEIEYLKRMGNTVSVRLAPTFLLGYADGYNHASATRYLSGLLEELAAVYLRPESATLTNLAPVLEKIREQIKGVSPAQQRPMLALFVVYCSAVNPESVPDDWLETANQYTAAFDEPSVEALIAATLGGLNLAGPIEPLEAAFNTYLNRRSKKNAFHLPPLFDAAIALELAEAYREAGSEDDARRLIQRAVELYPGAEPLLALEQPGPLPVIQWHHHLGLPPQPGANSALSST